MNPQLTYTKQDERTYDVLFETEYLGKLFKQFHFDFMWFPNKKYDYALSAWMLHDIANKLDELNA